MAATTPARGLWIRRYGPALRRSRVQGRPAARKVALAGIAMICLDSQRRPADIAWRWKTKMRSVVRWENGGEPRNGFLLDGRSGPTQALALRLVRRCGSPMCLILHGAARSRLPGCKDEGPLQEDLHGHGGSGVHQNNDPAVKSGTIPRAGDVPLTVGDFKLASLPARPRSRPAT